VRMTHFCMIPSKAAPAALLAAVKVTFEEYGFKRVSATEGNLFGSLFMRLGGPAIGVQPLVGFFTRPAEQFMVKMGQSIGLALGEALTMIVLVVEGEGDLVAQYSAKSFRIAKAKVKEQKLARPPRGRVRPAVSGTNEWRAFIDAGCEIMADLMAAAGAGSMASGPGVKEECWRLVSGRWVRAIDIAEQIRASTSWSGELGADGRWELKIESPTARRTCYLTAAEHQDLELTLGTNGLVKKAQAGKKKPGKSAR
jgi:hypothetical protein